MTVKIYANRLLGRRVCASLRAPNIGGRRIKYTLTKDGRLISENYTCGVGRVANLVLYFPEPGTYLLTVEDAGSCDLFSSKDTIFVQFNKPALPFSGSAGMWACVNEIWGQGCSAEKADVSTIVQLGDLIPVAYAPVKRLTINMAGVGVTVNFSIYRGNRVEAENLGGKYPFTFDFREEMCEADLPMLVLPTFDISSTLFGSAYFFARLLLYLMAGALIIKAPPEMGPLLAMFVLSVDRVASQFLSPATPRQPVYPLI